jgi:hypothetical protein
MPPSRLARHRVERPFAEQNGPQMAHGLLRWIALSSQVIDYQDSQHPDSNRGPTDYKSGGVKIGQISHESGPVGRHCQAGSSIFAMEIGIVWANRDNLRSAEGVPIEKNRP